MSWKSHIASVYVNKMSELDLHHKQTIPELICDSTETSSSIKLQCGCFGPYPSVIAVFRPAKTNKNKGGRNET